MDCVPGCVAVFDWVWGVRLGAPVSVVSEKGLRKDSKGETEQGKGEANES